MAKRFWQRWVCVLLSVALWLPAWTVTADSLPDQPIAYYITEKENVSFRSGAGTNFDTIAHFSVFTVLKCYAQVTGSDGMTWYVIKADVELYGVGMRERTGYVRADMVRMPTDAELSGFLALGGRTSGGTGGSSTSGGGTYTDPGAPATGYEIVNIGGNAYMRAASDSSSASVGRLPSGTLVRYLGSERGSDGYVWHRVAYLSSQGYIRSDLLRAASVYEVQMAGQATPTPSPVPTIAPVGVAAYETVNVSSGNAYLRGSASSSANAVATIPRGTVVSYIGQTYGSDGYVWHQVRAGSQVGYIRSDLLRKSTDAEILSIGGATPTPIPLYTPIPTAAGNTSNYETVNVSSGNAYMRATANSSSEALAVLPRGTVVKFENFTNGSDGYIWHKVSRGSQVGYIRSDLLRASTEQEIQGAGLFTPPPAQAAPDGGYYYIVKENVSIYSQSHNSGTPLATVNAGQMIIVYATGVGMDGSTMWAQVKVGNTTGYTPFVTLRVATNAEIAGTGGVTPPPATGGYYYVTLESMYVYTQASSSSTALASIPASQLLTVLQTSVGADGAMWAQVKVGNVTGYVLFAKLRVATSAEINGTVTPPSTTGYYVTLYSMNMYSQPNSASTTANTVAYGKVVQLIQTQIGTDGKTPWALIKYNGNSGYVPNNTIRQATAAEVSGTTVTPTPGAVTQAPATGTFYVTKENLYLYNTKSTSGTPLTSVALGKLVDVLETSIGLDGGTMWAKVKHNNVTGYVPFGSLRVATTAEITAGMVVPTPAPVTGTYYVTKENLYLYNTKSTVGTPLTSVASGKVVDVLDTSIGLDGGTMWATVKYNNVTGYVPFGSLRVATAADITPTQPANAQYYVSLQNANMLNVPSASGTAVAAVPALKLVTVLRSGAGVDGQTWAEIKYGTVSGYMLMSNLRVATAAEIAAGGGSVTPVSTYWTVKVTNAYVRQSASTSSTSLTKLPNGTVMQQLGSTMGADGFTWYQIKSGIWSGYVRSDLVRASSSAEIVAAGYPAPGTAPTPTPTPGTTTGVNINSLMAVKSGGTNLRTGNGTSFGLVTKLARGEIVTVLGSGTGSDGAIWYRVTTATQSGHVRGDLLRPLTEAEKAQYGQQAASAAVTYRTLKVGMSGEDVTRLQQALKAKGYLNVAQITDYYGDITRVAVANFQQVSGLYADGIAGADTQHRLFGTTPAGSTGGNASPTGKVQMADWFTSNIRSLLASQRTFTIIDVATRKSVQVRFLNGAQHADVEPLTAADTAMLKSGSGSDRMYGSYRRPAWAVIGGNTYACSLYVVAHGTEDTIKDNDFTGVFCVHFLNSTTHVDPTSPNEDHQSAIQQAFNAGQ